MPLATLFGILANRGAGWGTSDEELEQLLIDESSSHPADLPRSEEGRSKGNFLIETTLPDHRITLTDRGVAVVRSLGDRDRQPSIWVYESVRPTGPGRMLVVADGEGVQHRLGMVTLISRIHNHDATIEGLRRAEIGNWVWCVTLEDGTRILLTHRLHMWQVDRRTVKKTTHAWSHVVRCRVGENFAYVSAGGEEVVLGIVDKLLLVES
ncbi:hypothetical protein QYQ98_07310 [Corynebacterium sp. P3-F1]|uniref:hypothetical protein n=1 Tax=Corynebacterium sp. P3-F1 TaxID=3059080 RepID=UPI00265CA7A7|nr:hypothetical protein [Corynebacterium sp. P3-F1]WKK60840.1 hypothetical protein QYQ98_07310 [Corynebacterium sp. P3-F1]